VLSEIKKYLNQPYPLPHKPWRVIIAISVFIALFIFLFQPFGLTETQSHLKVYIFLGYGAVTFVVQYIILILFPKIIPDFFNENKWTFLREYILLLSILFFIGVGNFFYSNCIFSFDQNVTLLFVFFQVSTLLIGLFPVTVVLVMNQNKKLKQSLINASELTQIISNKNLSSIKQPEAINLSSNKTSNTIQINPNNVCYINSQGNYIVVFENVEGKVVRKILRTTLKSIESKLHEFPFIYRCHRAFMININRIEKVTGNAQGLRVTLIGCSDAVLVSRSYVAVFKSILKNQSNYSNKSN